MFIWTNETSRIPQSLICTCPIHTSVLICCFTIQFHILTLIRRDFWLNETVVIKVSDDYETDDDDLDGLERYKQTCSSWVFCFWGHNHHDGMWQDSLIQGYQSEMDDDDGGRDDWYKQVWWSDVSHINVCEGVRAKITKNVRERDEDGWEGRRKVRERGELGEDSIW